MTPARYNDFFFASAGVSGALIGLLFVAISVAPERLLDEDAPQAHRVRAAAALTAFVNALTVSLFALVPEVDDGWTALVVAAIGIAFVSGSVISLLRKQKTQPHALRDATFLAGQLLVFVLQAVYGIDLIGEHGRGSALSKSRCSSSFAS